MKYSVRKYKCWWLIPFVSISATLLHCEKILQIDAPIDSITTEQSFSDSVNANSAVSGIYSAMINTSGTLRFGSGAVTRFGGLSSDELRVLDPEGSNQFYNNAILSDNPEIYTFWKDGYAYIYQINSCIEGLTGSPGLSESLKQRLIGEIRFLRAYCYFYLVNLFGDVPLVTSTDWKKESTAKRESVQTIYDFMIADLMDCIEHAAPDYSLTNGEKARANKWSAYALLARVYLYIKDWENAAHYASLVIENMGNFSLSTTLDEVFLKNSTETILAFAQDTKFFPFNATTEGANFRPSSPFYPPEYFLNTELLNSFENGDNRRSDWIDSMTSYGTLYYYPNKYKIGSLNSTPDAAATEYSMILRLSEQYLIRSEARLKLGDILGAEQDVNAIRIRADLSPVSFSNEEEGIQVILAERRHELFMEGGHRWLDLKRLNIADEVLSSIKPHWKATSVLFPIPLTEMQRNPMLQQNTGY